MVKKSSVKINYSDILLNWHSMNEVLVDLSEEEVKSLLDYEMKNKQRPQFVIRLNARFNRLRTEREQRELLSKIGENK